MKRRNRRDPYEITSLVMLTMMISGASALGVYAALLSHAYRLPLFWLVGLGAAVLATLMAYLPWQYGWWRLLCVLVGVVGPTILSSASPSWRPLAIGTWIFISFGAWFGHARESGKALRANPKFVLAGILLGLAGPGVFYAGMGNSRGLFFSMVYIMGSFFLVFLVLVVCAIWTKLVRRSLAQKIEETFHQERSMVRLHSSNKKQWSTKDFPVISPTILPEGFEETDRNEYRHKGNPYVEIVYEDSEKNLVWLRESNVPVPGSKASKDLENAEERIGGTAVSLRQAREKALTKRTAKDGLSFKEASWKQGETYINLRADGLSLEEMRKVIASMVGVSSPATSHEQDILSRF